MPSTIRIAKLKPDPYPDARMANAADDIARLRDAFASAGIVADDATIFEAWVRHSDEHAASWLILYPSHEDNLAALLRQVDLHDPLPENGS